MSIGITGPIGLDNLDEFARAVAFRPLVGKPNVYRVACKLCGAALPKGAAKRVAIYGGYGHDTMTYVCPTDCAGLVAAWLKHAAATLSGPAKETAERFIERWQA